MIKFDFFCYYFIFVIIFQAKNISVLKTSEPYPKKVISQVSNEVELKTNSGLFYINLCQISL